MTPARRPRSRLRLLRLLPAVAFAIALTAGHASASLSPDEHAAACHCGAKCRREACCCGPRKKAESPPAADVDAEPSSSPVPVPDHDPGPIDAESGPCLAAAPGGDDLAAPAKTVPVGGDEKGCVGFDPRLAARRGDRLPLPSSDRASTADASRIDRPPEPAPSA